MGARILYDGLNLSLKTGTGIATYTRNLTSAAKAAGHHVSVAFSVRDKIPSDPVLREIMLFEERPRQLRKKDWRRNWVLARTPWSRRQRLWPATPGATVLTDAVRDRLPVFDELYVGRQIFERARARFTAQGRFTDLDADERPDIAHFTFPTPVRSPGSLNLYTVHDLVPMRLPFTTMDGKAYFTGLHRALARGADHIVTVSEHSRQDIIRLLGVPEDRVTNTYQAVSVPAAIRDKPDDRVAEELGGLFNLEPGRYFLFFGAIEPKKNVKRLLEAFLSSGVDLPLVIVSSSGWMNEDELAVIKNRWFQRRGLGDRERRRPKIRHLDYVPADVLATLIRGARAVTFPSLYEGFGLPVLEAMTLGTPVLTSTASCLPEVAGDAALLVDPTDVEAIRQGIRTLAADDGLCRDLSSRGLARAELFSMTAYEQRVADLYARLGFPAT